MALEKGPVVFAGLQYNVAGTAWPWEAGTSWLCQGHVSS